MKTAILGATALALMSTSHMALAANDLETMMDLAVRGMMADGAEVSYDEKIVVDGSVEYRGLEIVNPVDEIKISTDWLRGTPSGDNETEVTFTLADTVTFEMLTEGLEKTVEMRTQGFALTTNAVLRDAMATDDIYGAVSIDSLAISDGDDGEHLMLHDLEVLMQNVSANIKVSMEDRHVEGAAAFGDSEIVYDFSADSERQSGRQVSEPGRATFAFDFADGEEETMMGYMMGQMSAFLNVTGGASVFDMLVESPDMSMQMSGKQGDGTFNLSVSDATASISGEADAFEFSVALESDMMPVPPFSISAEGMSMKIVAPMMAVEAPKEAVYALSLNQFAVSEALWAMIDPGQEIPRDAAQLDIDLEALVMVNPMLAMQGAEPQEFIEIQTLDVNTILLSLAGALVHAEGAMTFNNDGPMPIPNGTINVEAKGIMTLANTLVSLGLLDQMQAGMAMGMMMAFGQQGEEPDTFTSEIAFSQDGIMANGVPIQ